MDIPVDVREAGVIWGGTPLADREDPPVAESNTEAVGELILKTESPVKTP